MIENNLSLSIRFFQNLKCKGVLETVFLQDHTIFPPAMILATIVPKLKQ